MRVQIAARHCNVPKAVRDRTRELILKLTRYESRLSSAEVVFDRENHLRRAEAVLSIDGAKPVVAGGEAEDFRGALDQLVDRLAKILRRRHSQRLDHQAVPLVETPDRDSAMTAD